jgi:hypothetical protein
MGEEYRSWAIELRRRGHLVRAERLGSETRTLGSRQTGATDTSGFFLIRAATIAEATALARECPHLRHGGTVTVRSVDPT